VVKLTNAFVVMICIASNTDYLLAFVPASWRNHTHKQHCKQQRSNHPSSGPNIKQPHSTARLWCWRLLRSTIYDPSIWHLLRL
jgi:hypothetical protein